MVQSSALRRLFSAGDLPDDVPALYRQGLFLGWAKRCADRPWPASL